MPEIILLSGIPCSGKSSYIKKYYPDHAVLSRDDIRKYLFKEPYRFTKENEKRVTTHFNILYKVYTQDKRNIVLDNTHVKEEYIDAEIARKPEGYDLRIIFFDIPLWKANIRNVLRYLWSQKWIPFKVMKNMNISYKKLNKSKYSTYICK